MPVNGHWKITEYTVPGNARKREENVGIRAIFYPLTERWMLGNKRFLELTRTHCPCEHRKTRYIHKVHRMVNIGKQAFSWIHAGLLSAKIKEKHKKIPENDVTHGNFRKFAERWTLENTRFLEFSWIRCLGKQKKTGENFCERQNTLCFPYVNRAVNCGKQCVLQNLPAFGALENKVKCGFSIVNLGWTWSFTPGKHLWTRANKTFAKC